MIAVDTNILVYAVDSNETIKGPLAATLIEHLARGLTGQRAVIPYQVVAEFGAVFVRKKLSSQLVIDLPTMMQTWFDAFRWCRPHPRYRSKAGDSWSPTNSRIGTRYSSPRARTPASRGSARRIFRESQRLKESKWSTHFSESPSFPSHRQIPPRLARLKHRQ